MVRGVMIRTFAVIAMVVVPVASWWIVDRNVGDPQRELLVSTETENYRLANVDCDEIDDVADIGLLPRLREGTATMAVTEPVEAPANVSVLAFAPDGRSFLGERNGVIWFRDVDGEVDAEPVIDLSGNTNERIDQGLLGLAVDPERHLLYVNHTDGDDRNVVRAFPLGDDWRPLFEPDDSGEVVFRVDDLSPEHNGGSVVVGPDGMLYASFGDGGGQGDPLGRAQDRSTIFGKIVRIDPHSDGDGYDVPPDNPWADDPDAAPESWIVGVRNPFRFAFDQETGDFWVADVGQACVEEINVVSPGEASGANLGWSAYEGSRRFIGPVPADHHSPLFEYGHGNGACAVVGGVIYRGEALPELQGRYVFSDFCTELIFALDPDNPVRAEIVATGPPGMISIVEDPEGELFIGSIGDGLHRLVAGD